MLGVLTWLSWFITDDAFIAFRYVRNFVEGHGLVFNPGESVEGYSSFLWVLQLAAIWKLFGLPPEDVAQWLSVGWTAGVIALLLWWARRDTALPNRGLAGWMALGLVCGSATFAVWTSGGGLETRQFTFFVLAAIVALTVHGRSRWGLPVASFCLAGAALTRPEGILIAACCFAWFAASRMLAAPAPDARRAAWRRLIDWIDRREIACLAAPFIVIVGAHLAFRLAYYGEWLPNTYYAKIVRPWYEAGFRYYLGAAVDTGLYLLLPLAFLALRSRWRSRRDIAYALPLLCIAVHAFGVMRVGGDHFEWRPLDFYWPALSIPVAAAILDLGSRLAGTRLLQRFIPPRVSGASFWSVAIFIPVLVYCSAIQGMSLLTGYREDAAHRQPYVELNAENAGWLLDIPGMAVLVPISNDLRRLATKQLIAVSSALHGAYANGRIEMWSPYRNMERGLIPVEALSDDRGAAGALGITYYYLPDLRVIDHLGLTDATIARNPVRIPNSMRRIAHDRRPPRGYMEDRGVNIRVHPPTNSEGRALSVASFALKVGPELWMPFDGLYGFDESIAAKFPDYALSIRGVTNFEYLLEGLNLPVIQSDYNVYIVDRHIIYKKESCVTGQSGVRRRPHGSAGSEYSLSYFFLHVFPVDPDDLPVWRRQFGFDNFMFAFWEYGRRIDGSCVVVRRLPDYAIASIGTGEVMRPEGGRIWDGHVDFVERTGGGAT